MRLTKPIISIKNAAIFALLLPIIWAIYVIFFAIPSDNEEYVFFLKSEIKGRISKIENRGRGTKCFEMNNSIDKYFYTYTSFIDTRGSFGKDDMLIQGDSVFKNSNSDTIWVTRDGITKMYYLHNK